MVAYYLEFVVRMLFCLLRGTTLLSSNIERGLTARRQVVYCRDAECEGVGCNDNEECSVRYCANHRVIESAARCVSGLV
jgi:hypothetical protein